MPNSLWRASFPRLSSSGEFALFPAPAATAGDIPGDATSTTVITVGGAAISSDIDQPDDIDFIKVQLSAGQTYQFNLSAAATNGLDDPWLGIYNSDGTSLLGQDDDSGGNLNARLTYRVETSGTYFLGVEGIGDASGNYTLSAVKATVKADDYTDSTSTSGTITVDGDWRTGQLEAMNDQDWFKVQLTADHDYVFTLWRADTNGFLDTYIELYSSAGSFIDDNDDMWYSDDYKNTNSNLTYTPTTTGTYYLSAGGFEGIGGYWLAAEEDDFPADTGTAGVVSFNGLSVYGWIQSPGDVDWIATTLTGGQSYLFFLEGTAESGQPDPYLQIYDANGAFVAENDDAYDDVRYSTLIVEAPASGTYYLAAQDTLGYGVGGYQLTAYVFQDGTAGGDTLAGGAQADWLESYDGNDSLTGGAALDVLYGGLGNDTLVGGGGTDFLYGGPGDDLFIIDADDLIDEYAGEGIDVVQSPINYTLGFAVDDLLLTGTAARGTGNADWNILTGNAANNTLSGGEGEDTLIGAGGADSLVGGVGKDRLVGGPGNDSYLVDAGDKVVEVAGAGVDTIRSAASWNFSASANVEVLILTGGADINGTGDDKPNKITGNTGDNELNGRGGADTLTGGKGDDIYTVDAAGDSTVESSGAGSDLVRSSVNWTLAANVEDLSLTGTAAINGTGNSSANTITGNAGNNRLDGKAGVDTLLGKAGNDSYVVDQAADTVDERVGEGTDTVIAATDFVLPVNVEVLKFVESEGGALDRRGTGNALPNVLEGGAGDDELNGLGGNDTLLGGIGGDDTLNGGLGGDSMLGGTGDDVYEYNDVGDVYVELAGEGAKDTVEATISHTLLPNVEILKLEGVGNINGTGNVLGNIMEGNSGNNQLSGLAGDDKIEAGEGADTLVGGLGNDEMYGGTGVDVMQGGDGDDTYYVDDVNDDTVEVDADGLLPAGTVPSPDATGSNIDTVISQVSYTLRSNIEKLQIEGSANLSGTGNELDNTLSGNGGANLLKGLGGIDIIGGGAGSDTLAGGDGNDTLAGGDGADAFVFETALSASTNKDTVVDFLAGTDKLRLDDDVFTQLGGTGALAAAKFRMGAGVTKAQDADDRIVYNTTTGALYYDPDGTGAKAAVAFAVLGTNAHPDITAADFLIIG